MIRRRVNNDVGNELEVEGIFVRPTFDEMVLRREVFSTAATEPRANRNRTQRVRYKLSSAKGLRPR